MGWLRKQGDLIGLIVVWTILLQSIVLPFTTGLHAATLLSGTGEAGIICTSRGVAVAQKLPGQNHQKPDCQCCLMACRQGCAAAGLLPTLTRVPLPSSITVVAATPRHDAPALKPAAPFAAQPRAPPLA